MEETYYYSQGRRVSVLRLESAKVVRLPEDREVLSVPGWHTVPLGNKRFQLLLRADVVSERSLGVRRLEDLTGQMLAAERESEAVRSASGRKASRGVALRAESEEALRAEAGGQVAPALVGQEGGLLLPTGEVVAKFHAGRDAAEVERSVRERGGVVVEALAFLPDTYLLRPVGGGDGLDLANALSESGLVEFASPNFIEEMPPRAVAPPPNALFPRQWHLHSTGQNGARPGADVRALEAWEITKGSPEVVICIIDSGIDSRHDAFSAPGKLVPGFDFEDDDPYADPTSSSHGTSCAGVAAAPWGVGQVVGVAPFCSLMPVRRATLSEHLKMAEALAWAADRGADVISCSFGYDQRPWVLPDVVRAAIDRAAAVGRGGRGCVIVWAAGNGDEPVSADEWASYGKVIAVAASTDQDVRAPYSDYGPEVALCAPSNGGLNGITTTANGGYTSQFGGTSSSAPLVAGVAALLLSVAPNLTREEVRDILCRSAERIDEAGGGYGPDGHSPLYGFGRVNAHKALLAVSALHEAARGSDVARRLERVRQFASQHLAPRAAGQQILQFLTLKRFRVLELLKLDADFRRDVVTVLRAVADAQDTLPRSLALPEPFWGAVAAVARPLLSEAGGPRGERGHVAPGRRATAGFEPSTTPIGLREEINMPDNSKPGRAKPAWPTTDESAERGTVERGERGTADLDDALKRLADVIRGSLPPQTSPPTQTPPKQTPVPAPPVGDEPAQTIALREQIATELMYMRMIPPLTPDILGRIDEILRQLPETVKTLAGSPYMMAQVEAALASAGLGSSSDGDGGRSAADDPELTALVQRLAGDALSGRDERVLPLGILVLGGAIAAAGAGVTVGRAIYGAFH